MLQSLLGGLMIGLASSLLMLMNGRIAGIAGITSNALPPKMTPWAIAFVLGLPLGVFLYHQITGAPVSFPEMPLPLLIVAGLLVGIGTRMGSGCTSGHGVCGLSRLSPRSLAATMIFMGIAMLTVFAKGVIA